MRMSVAINAVEGYDGAERGCMLPMTAMFIIYQQSGL